MSNKFRISLFYADPNNIHFLFNFQVKKTSKKKNVKEKIKTAVDPCKENPLEI